MPHRESELIARKRERPVAGADESMHGLKACALSDDVSTAGHDLAIRDRQLAVRPIEVS
jgi:hypothetical protein